MNEYLTIQEVATITGVSRQAVYQRIDKDLKEYVKLIKGKKMLNNKALKMFNTNSIDKQVDNIDKQLNKQLTSTLQAQIDLLTKQLEIKDKQLADNSILLTQLTTSLQQSQELNLNNQLLLKSEQNKSQPLLTNDEAKKSWFNWFKK